MPRQHELINIQKSIEGELNGDAAIVSKELFGDKMPDMGTTTDAEALAMMRSKYLMNDQQWLAGEAQRDPNQFLRLSKQLGVVDRQTGQPFTE